MSDSLVRAATRTAAEADRISALFARQLAKVLRQTDSTLRAWLAQNGPELTPPLRSVRTILRNAGYDGLADAATAAPFDRMAERVIAQRTAAGVPSDVGELAALRLEAWRTLHVGDLFAEGDILARSLMQAIARGLTGPRRARRLKADVSDLLDGAESRIHTIYDTAVSIYGRQVEADQAGDETDTVFTYMGPVDNKTRDFCLAHVGRVYTRAEIDALDNGQISNVFLTGGGWQCRHTWHEISKFSELQDLKGTTKRVPEIMDAVREVRAHAA